MTLAKALVTAGGLAAMAWVLWYFLAVPRRSGGAPRARRP